MQSDVIAHFNAALAGRYDVEREIGAGGMATVYLARDLRHDRRVALKVLDPELGAQLGPERFLAEIRVTANLQHPNILPLFDSGEAHDPVGGGARFLFYVMPYVDGESLRARLARERQLPIGDALQIALGVAHALEYAHRRGVVHRDVKPENILLQAGQPVVADFGIALAVQQAGGARLTQTGMSLGTPQYMSPEQAAGERTLDGRSDIYSLAAVLYEMLAGEPPHTGSTAQAVIAKVITEKSPRVRTSRANVPAHVDGAIERALEKLAADRFASAAEFAAALQGSGALSAGAHVERVSSDQSVLATQMIAGHAPRRRSMPRASKVLRSRWLAAAVLFVAGTLLGRETSRVLAGRATDGVAGPVVRASLPLAPDAPLALANLPPVGFNGSQLALAPDGSALAYIASTAAGNVVYVREIATGETRALAGTEGAKIAVFAPDGAWLAFATADHIKKIPRAGGAAIELCAASTMRLWWPEPSSIDFDPEFGLLSRVPADGGAPEQVANAHDFGGDAFSDVLPGGTAALVDGNATGGSAEHGDILFVDLTKHRATVLVHGGYGARYAADGAVVFARAGGLFGLRFDPRHGAAAGEPVAIASGVSMESGFSVVQASASIGVLAFVPGTDISRGKLAWIDRGGRADFIDAPELAYRSLDLAPDDRHIAVQVADVADYLSVWDVVRHEGQRVPAPGPEGFPRWSADGRRLAGVILDRRRLAMHEVDGLGRVADAAVLPDSASSTSYFSPRGDVLAVAMPAARFRTAFVRLRPDAPTPQPFDGDVATFSPDGKWLAYMRVERGAPEVFLRSFPEGRVVGPVSHGGGIEPRWKPSGELYYRNGHRWYATTVTTGPEPRWDPPHLVFDAEFIDTPGWSYDVSRDGQRLLVVKRDRPIETSRIELITNWTRLLGH